MNHNPLYQAIKKLKENTDRLLKLLNEPKINYISWNYDLGSTFTTQKELMEEVTREVERINQ